MPDTALAPRLCFLGAGCLDKLLRVTQIACTLPCALESKASPFQDLAGPQVCGRGGDRGSCDYNVCTTTLVSWV